MAIHRGIQSAIFYYVSCAPCAEARVRRQRKEEAKRDRIDRLALEAEMPDLYRHPSPSSTNPHWQTEIMLGPTPTTRGNRKKAGGGAAGRSNNSGVPSSVSLPPGSASTMHDSKLNLRMYQREDEELWGSCTNLDGPASSPDILRRPPRALTKDAALADYRSFRNPSINDLHPATVTRVRNREDVLWMMQPVPVAEVMSGKEAVSVTRSDGGASRRRTPNVTPLSNPVSDRTVERVYGVGSPTVFGLSRENSSRASNHAIGQRHDRMGTPVERDFAFMSPPPQRQGSRQSSIRDQRSPQLLPIDPSPEELSAGRRSLAPSPTLYRRPSQTPKLGPSRPPLSAIASESLISTASTPSLLDSQSFYTPAETPTALDKEDPLGGDRTPTQDRSDFLALDASPRLAANSAAPDTILLHKNSLHLLPALSSPSAGAVVDAQIFTASTDPKGGPLRLRRHRSQGVLRPERLLDDHYDDMQSGEEHLSDSRDEGSDVLEKWGMPGFEPSQWIHEHTKREGVRERWSMEL